MATGVDVIASVIAIAGVGIKLSKTLYQISHKTANAGHNINRIATNVSLFASMLKHVGRVLDDANSLHSPEAVETVKQIINECESVFQEITSIIVLAKDKTNGGSKDPPLANGSKRRISMIARAKWYFEGPKADHLLAQLEYLKTTLSVLLQTLNLAALNAQIKATMGEPEDAPEIIQQEKLHIETLVVAQQLSVHVMQEAQEKMDEENTNPPSPTEDGLDRKYPKLLTQGSSHSLQLVRFNSNNMNFLDRKVLIAEEDGAPLDHTISRSEAFIQSLLAKWTIPPEARYVRADSPSSNAEVLEGDRHATPVPNPTQSFPNAVITRDANIVSTPTTIVTPTSDIAPFPPAMGPLRRASGNPSNIRSGSSPGTSAPKANSISNRAMSPSNALERSITNPEADSMPILTSFHDHHGLVPQIQEYPPSNHMTSTHVLQAPQMLSSHHPTALAPYIAGAAAASGNVHLDPGWSNYRQPYVSDEDSTWSPSDSDDSRAPSKPGGVRTRRNSKFTNTTRPSKRSHHRPHDSGHGDDTGDGLDIPWRIRVSTSKYFDYRDDILVGPRTPYLPQESKSWIYGQETARTEISTKWVCKEALNEMRYPHNELRGSPENSGIVGEEGGWRILQPLKFHEIDALVTRTIQHVEMKKQRQSGSAAPLPPVRPQPVQHPLPMPHHPPFERRNLSYNDAMSPLHPPQGPPPRGIFAHQGPPSRDLGEVPYSPRDRHVRGERREFDFDRESNRDRNRERRRSRSRHRHREKEREKQPAERKKEKHKSSMGTTLAKVGTLAVLLEGLDGAFL